MNKKILIVRGDSSEAKALSFVLSGTGYNTSFHTTADKALEAARHERFDLAITDRALPENGQNLHLVSRLKETQPSLPIFLMSDAHDLDSIIESIRAGVTDIIENPDDLKSVFETTRDFLGTHEDSENDVSWEDIQEVEKALKQLKGDDSIEVSGEDISNSQSFIELQSNHEASQKELEDKKQDLEALQAKLTKAEALLDELKNHGESGSSADIIERTAELDAKQRELEERAARISKQKVEVETQLGELDAQRIEFEEAQLNPELSEGGRAELEELQTKANETRLDYEARIQDLQRELENVKANGGNSEKLENENRELREQLHSSREDVAEKEFLLSQKETEISNLNESASNASIDELEEEKRLLEIERFKLQEKLDKLELEKRALEEDHGKRAREINVEKRDAEISLREMQTKIKEEQLKLQAQQTLLKDEMRQFDQAKQNFQEDVQELQKRQTEISQIEDRLRKMEEEIGSGNALPRPERSAPIPEQKPFQPKSIEKDPNEKAEDPTSWSKPPFEKKGNRGPLRIGRKSSV